MLAFGAVFKRAVVDAVGRHGPVPAAIATAAIGFALGELAKSVFGADMRPRFALAGPAAIDVAGIAVPVADLAVIVAGLVALLIALTFLGDTRVGRAIQAVIQNRTAAQALGIRVGRMVLYVFVLNAALAGVASILLGLPAQPKAAGATSLTVAALAASVLGGFALRGTTGAALALGVIEQLLAGMVAAPYRPAVLPVVLVGVVAIRPQSLFGARKEKVA
jgi:branched-chain amino acid transport system permease protein